MCGLGYQKYYVCVLRLIRNGTIRGKDLKSVSGRIIWNEVWLDD